ncbi:metal ABC transporter permease [Fluviibacter phosphoraccumulans]|jgi:zinc/manganese transport system permease protein|uniref:ABC transporter n=1 Tax=Fluviibacter phosphoraccumulans TaxID=1751046 RepID=A0A7R6R0G9_9RHOO|nr:metal ABC transporter permease [Fluviibacter phosphoraccumulans]BBU68071.1 ABC transporter [Fluviibacter phosphoraccumulans]BBU70389.1 ABC transporter [Fluviibacter phosphoraccumulans]
MNDIAVFADILLPAFVAGLLVICTHIPLGFKVLSRGIIFMDLAIAQVAGLGALFVTVVIGEQAPPLLTQTGATLLALAAALLLLRCERLTQRYQEPLIGILFVLAATAGILVLAGDPHAGEHMTELLSGQILWVSREQLITSGGLTGILLVALWVTRQSHAMFYALFAVAITLSVQLVGVYLVFATLIIPALSTVPISHEKRRLKVAYALAIVGYGVGLSASALLDLPTGPLIVWTLAICGAITASVAKTQHKYSV